MADKKTYSDKLKDPRWQKLRLDVFNRDGFTCQECGSTTRTLHVHHKFYQNCEPWEYPLDALTTLCHQCHESIDSTESPDEAKLNDTIEELRSIGCSTAEINNHLAQLYSKKLADRQRTGRTISTSFLQDLDNILEKDKEQ